MLLFSQLVHFDLVMYTCYWCAISICEAFACGLFSVFLIMMMIIVSYAAYCNRSTKVGLFLSIYCTSNDRCFVYMQVSIITRVYIVPKPFWRHMHWSCIFVLTHEKGHSVAVFQTATKHSVPYIGLCWIPRGYFCHQFSCCRINFLLLLCQFCTYVHLVICKKIWYNIICDQTVVPQVYCSVMIVMH